MGRRRLRHPQHRLPAGAARPGARHSSEAQVEILESLDVFPSTLPTKRESAYAGLGVDLASAATTPARSASSPACGARRRTAVPARSSPRSRRSSTRASRRSPCSARTSTPTAWSSATGRRSRKLLRACGEIEGLERVRFTSPHPAEFTDDVIEAMAETPNVMPQPAHAAAVRLVDRSSRTCAGPTGSEKFLGIIERVRASACRTRPSPPTSSSASPARPRRTSRRR